MIEQVMLAIMLFVGLAMLILFTLEYRLHRAAHNLREHMYSRFLMRVEFVLRDFILAYDDQEPERLLGVYQETEEPLESIENYKGKVIGDLPDEDH